MIISAAVLLSEPSGDGVMRQQVWHLLKATELPGVTIRVLPLSVNPHRSSYTGGWILMDFVAENGNTPPATVIAVRDTKDNGNGPALTFTPAEWDVFVGGTKDGEFDL